MRMENNKNEAKPNSSNLNKRAKRALSRESDLYKAMGARNKIRSWFSADVCTVAYNDARFDSKRPRISLVI